jgi:glycosyltransferase involved in cell wall biosynthesis
MTWADLVVFNFYRHPVAAALLKHRVSSEMPWCFWGERPGAHNTGLPGMILRRFRLWSLWRSKAAIWGIGNWAVDGWRKEFGSMRSYCNVPYFSNLTRFAGRPAERRSGGIRFLFSGSLIHRKGVDLLARSFLEVIREFPNSELILAGVGPMKEEMAEVMAPCGDRVRFKGFVPWKNLPDTYHEADVLCAPSRHDGWAMVVPEALAAGLPVITSTNTGAAHDLVKEGKNGWSVLPDDQKSLTRAMLEAAGLNHDRLREMSHAATASVADHQLVDGVRRFQAAAAASLKA